MLSGSIEIRRGEHLEQSLIVEAGDLLYVPPRETHIVVNPSDSEPAEYVVARDSPTEDSVEVPWARAGRRTQAERAAGDPTRRVFERLDFLYMPSADVAAEVAYFTGRPRRRARVRDRGAWARAWRCSASPTGCQPPTCCSPGITTASDRSLVYQRRRPRRRGRRAARPRLGSDAPTLR